LIERQALSGSFIGSKRMTNQRLMQEVTQLFYGPSLNVCLREYRMEPVFVRTGRFFNLKEFSIKSHPEDASAETSAGRSQGGIGKTGFSVCFML
jgi:hypothetical protein